MLVKLLIEILYHNRLEVEIGQQEGIVADAGTCPFLDKEPSTSETEVTGSLKKIKEPQLERFPETLKKIPWQLLQNNVCQ